jgi:DNA-binding HxlR family transcriptional regulator
MAAIDPLSVALLVRLLAGPATEVEVVEALPGVGQPTCNRRLHRLRGAGLVEQEPGHARAPHRQWRILHPAEVESLLTAILDLSDAVENRNRQIRGELRSRLLRDRAERLGIRSIDAKRS